MYKEEEEFLDKLYDLMMSDEGWREIVSIRYEGVGDYYVQFNLDIYLEKKEGNVKYSILDLIEEKA